MHNPIEQASLNDALAKATAMLSAAQSVAILTGAGISAESGLATFRGGGGLWEGSRVEDVATPMAFERDPALVWRFYNARRASAGSVKPNPGHYALVQLAIINRPHFSLTPGIALGTFTGFNRDSQTNEAVKLRNVMKNLFSIGAELNAEIKIGRCMIFAGPSYYLFSMQDKVSPDWKQYKHFLGADIGLRVNLLGRKHS